MSDGFDTHDGLWAAVWDTFTQAAGKADHPARLMALATLSPQGLPQVRTVVLRGVARATAELHVFTDARSSKVAELAAHPVAALMVWDPATRLQIRVQASVTLDQGAALQSIWDRLPPSARQDYGKRPAPGQPIPDALAYTTEPDPAAFTRLTCRAEEIDVLHLGKDHRRAVFARSGDWRGEWLVP